MKVYLCGPINGCTDQECKEWRTLAKQTLPGAVDPMRLDYRGIEDINFTEIVEQDKEDIRRCDALLVNFIKPSVGTSMEILFAWQLDIPIIIVTHPTTAISPWLRYHATKIVHSFEEAFAILQTH